MIYVIIIGLVIFMFFMWCLLAMASITDDNMEKMELILDKNNEPCCDIIVCGKCHGTYMLSECPTEPEGDFETGYYTIHTCPKCEDGGEPEYNMSEQRANEWCEWNDKRK